MSPGDLELLRVQGFSGTAIHDAVQVISYFNYINRVADALGVDLEEWMPEKRQLAVFFATGVVYTRPTACSGFAKSPAPASPHRCVPLR